MRLENVPLNALAAFLASIMHILNGHLSWNGQVIWRIVPLRHVAVDLVSAASLVD